MHRIHHKDLTTLLEVICPRSLLVIDPNPEALPASGMPSECQVTCLQENVLAGLNEIAMRFDLAVVANTLEHLDRKTGGILLSRLRDLHARRFVVLVPLGNCWENLQSYWQTADLLGYGMTIMARYRVADKPLQLYHYAIESYKTTPEWFNSHHWAHPEHWKP
jgi:hypothetical protein